MGRHEQREQIFKLLFRVEFNSNSDMPEQVKLFFEEEEMLNISEKAMIYITDKYNNVKDQLTVIDELINEKAKGWDTVRMGKVELTVLRLAIYEIRFDDDVPNGVAINEAVEIAKKYGQGNSGSFVNAILAKFV